MSEPKKQKKKNKDITNGANYYAKYTGMAFQMIFIILAGVYGGKLLDEKLGLKNPIFLIIGSLLGVFGSLYFTLKDFIKKD